MCIFFPEKLKTGFPEANNSLLMSVKKNMIFRQIQSVQKVRENCKIPVKYPVVAFWKVVISI